MKFTFAALIFLIVFSSSAQEKYSRIEIFVPDRTTLERIWLTGIDYEGATGKIGGPMTFVTGAHELSELNRVGNVQLESLLPRRR